MRYVDLYPEVDLELVGEGSRLAPRLLCRADCPAALQAVRLRVEGAEAVSLSNSDFVARGRGKVR